MLDWIFLIIIILCVSGIGYIVIGKFSQLSNLDLDNLPEEKISRKKKEIISKRIEEKRKKIGQFAHHQLSPIVKLWRLLQLRFRIYVGQIRRLLWHEQSGMRARLSNIVQVDENKIRQLVQEGERYLSEKNYGLAEEKFIAVIKLDNRAAAAYRGLADTYFAKGSVEEARETYRFVLQIEPDDDSVLVKLADIAESQGDLEEAIQYYQQAITVNDNLSTRFARLAELLLKIGQPQVAKEAVISALELEPDNPKYLDLSLEIAILCQDKDWAGEALRKLMIVNPKNQKLTDLKQRIDIM